MKYEIWLENFLTDKKEVTRPPDKGAFHDVHRFVDQRGLYWEYAKTYTGRLTIRKGILKADGTSIAWESWVTLHDVEF